MGGAHGSRAANTAYGVLEGPESEAVCAACDSGAGPRGVGGARERWRRVSVWEFREDGGGREGGVGGGGDEGGGMGEGEGGEVGRWVGGGGEVAAGNVGVDVGREGGREGGG